MLLVVVQHLGASATQQTPAHMHTRRRGRWWERESGGVTAKQPGTATAARRPLLGCTASAGISVSTHASQPRANMRHCYLRADTSSRRLAVTAVGRRLRAPRT
jgi:uncharacterized protein (DUF2345 family)